MGVFNCARERTAGANKKKKREAKVEKAAKKLARESKQAQKTEKRETFALDGCCYKGGSQSF